MLPRGFKEAGGEGDQGGAGTLVIGAAWKESSLSELLQRQKKKQVWSASDY